LNFTHALAVEAEDRAVFEANSRLSNKIWQKLDQVDGGRIARLMATGDYMETWKFIEAEIFGMK
jgi:hypothetical protein